MDEEQAKQIKKQLLSQINKFPEEQRETLKEQIEEMDESQLEQFLVKNKLITQKEEESANPKQGAGECVFCGIIQGKVPTYKLDENKKAIAVLEINPLSYGHSLVLSKEHKKLPSSAFILASKIAKRIKAKFKADEVKIENVKIMGHEIIQVIPVYKGIKLEKKQAEEKELILLQDKLKNNPKKKREKPVKKSEENLEKLEKAPRRIP